MALRLERPALDRRQGTSSPATYGENPHLSDEKKHDELMATRQR